MHQAEKLLHAHLNTKATISSAGVLYGLCIAADAATNQINWPRVHDELKDHFKPATDRAWISQLERIKKAGWDMHAATTAYLT